MRSMKPKSRSPIGSCPRRSRPPPTQTIRILRLSDQVDILNPDPDPAKDQGPVEDHAQLIEDGAAASSAGRRSRPSTPASSKGLEKADENLEKLAAQPIPRRSFTSSPISAAIDWEEEARRSRRSSARMTEAGIKVHLVDVSTPSRPTDKSKPLAFSDNVGIVEFKPRTRVAAADEPVDFEVRLKNFGTTDLKDVQVYFYLNGQGHIIQGLPFPHIPAGQERMYVAQVTFHRDEEPKEQTLTPEQIQKELKERFQLVRR